MAAVDLRGEADDAQRLSGMDGPDVVHGHLHRHSDGVGILHARGMPEYLVKVGREYASVRDAGKARVLRPCRAQADDVAVLRHIGANTQPAGQRAVAAKARLSPGNAPHHAVRPDLHAVHLGIIHDDDLLKVFRLVMQIT